LRRYHRQDDTHDDGRQTAEHHGLPLLRRRQGTCRERDNDGVISREDNIHANYFSQRSPGLKVG
jgi:hypothetical protein